MRFLAETTTALSLLLSLGPVAHGFRDQAQKKQQKSHGRGLEDQVCTTNHDLAQTAEEITIHVQGFPGDSESLFDITISDPPYASEGSHVTVEGWCIDYDRNIETGNYVVDVFSAFDPDIHSNAVDKSERFPNLAWLINNVNVDDEFPSSEGCVGGPITMLDLQGAVWMIIDDKNGQGTGYQHYRTECIAEGVANWALTQGNDYTPDCNDPNELVPLVFVVDHDETGEILNQVIMSETKLSSIEGMCQCEEITTRTVDDEVTEEDKQSPSSFTKGDPHFKTHGGELYDFHGGCDLVLLDHPDFYNGFGMLIHIRTKIQTWWSYVESSVIRVGEDTIEIVGGNKTEWLYINGEPNDSAVEDQKWYTSVLQRHGTIVFVKYKQTGPNREAYLHIGSEIILLKTYLHFVRVELNAKGRKAFEGSLGLLGRHPDGIRVGRDGVAPIENVNEFGQAWQVHSDEPRLFHTYEGNDIVQHPQKCAMPTEDTPTKQKLRRRRLEGSDVTQVAAEKACAHLKSSDERRACIFDVLATQDLNMGSVW